MSDNDTETVALQQGDNSGYKTCEICNNPTGNTQVPVREVVREVRGSKAYAILLCDDCERGLRGELCRE